MIPRVWAPRASAVELHRPGREPVPMTAEQDGWWHGPHLAHGEDYAFALDGGRPLPDPRSGWQPAGVHGPSRVFDTGRHRWTDGWRGRDVRGALLYELHVGTFTPQGTLDAAIAPLDHLVELGVDVVELMPVAAFAGRHGWGYDGVGLYAVHEPYGGPAALQRFVDAAHGRGLGVCLDVVYNHLGPSGNYLPQFGPYFTDAHRTPWGPAVNLDGPGSEQVRAFVVDNALRWLREFHLDALRLDAVDTLVDDSGRHLLAELSDAVARLSVEVGRPLSLVAETDRNDPIAVRPTAQGGWGMTAQWADDVHHALHSWLTGERQGYYVDYDGAASVATALTRVFVRDGGLSTFQGREWGKPLPAGSDGLQFVAFDANHDQVGNRAVGDRPITRIGPGRAAASLALVLGAPTTPMLFMGEEWGARTPFQFFTDHAEPELAEAIRSGRVAEFSGLGWSELTAVAHEVPDPQSATTFEASRLDWAELTRPEHTRMLAWTRRLVALRRSEPELADGDLARTRVHRGPGDQWLVVHRGDLRVVASIADGPSRVPLDAPGGAQLLAAWDEVVLAEGAVILPGPGAALVRVGPTGTRPGTTAAPAGHAPEEER